MPNATILLRSHTEPELTRHRIGQWHALNPQANIVFYDGAEGGLGLSDDPTRNLVVFPSPRRQHYGYPQLFDTFRWIAEQFPGTCCHYTEYDAVPLRAGYLDTLQLQPTVILAGESKDFGMPGFRQFYDDCRFRAVEVVGRILDVPVRMAYAFGPSIILGASCVRYLGLFRDDDFERHIFPALDRIQPGYSYDEVIMMSLLMGYGFRREFNPAAKYIRYEPCDEERFITAQRDGEAFAVHAIKGDEPWAR